MKYNDLDWLDNCDRTSDNEDGSRFYGFDDDNGKTVWYDEDGNCDCMTDTPNDWSW